MDPTVRYHPALLESRVAVARVYMPPCFTHHWLPDVHGFLAAGLRDPYVRTTPQVPRTRSADQSRPLECLVPAVTMTYTLVANCQHQGPHPGAGVRRQVERRAVPNRWNSRSQWRSAAALS